MQFYRFEGIICDDQWAEENNDSRVLRKKTIGIEIAACKFNTKLDGRSFLFVEDATGDCISIGVITADSSDIEKKIEGFLNALGMELNATSIEEVTLGCASKMLEHACRHNYISDDEEILEQFGLDVLSSSGWFARNLDFGENLIGSIAKNEIYSQASGFLASGTLSPELDRIYAGSRKKNISGHPVHYFVQTDDHDSRRDICRLLLNALYANGRLRSRRYVYIDIRPGNRLSQKAFDCLYKSSAGGTVVVRYIADDDIEDDLAGGSRYIVESICSVMKKYRNQVLTVFCLPRECTATKEIFYENLGNTCFVEVKEEHVSGSKAEEFLRELARKNKVRTDSRLFAMLEGGRGYLTPELHDIFDRWYDKKLRTGVFPQYSEMSTVKQEIIRQKPRGSAYSQLMEMTGLDEAKKVITQALDYYKAQKLFADKGMKQERPAMHMIFTGNPGTAKTSVARLFAGIMKENGLLSKGNIIEVGRGDLIGKYVGWTAQMIQKKFREAKGSVLFIDEAYSLVDYHDGSYGDEAINTIVQEMENHRDDTVVIFAGYPDKMEGFLSKNPGLRSRIAFHVPFSDYSTDDLCSIAAHIAGQKGIVLSEDAVKRLHGIFAEARNESDFGNGRYVRNILEKARMAQMSRLLRMDYDSLGSSDIATICAEDIEMPVSGVPAKKNRIGFCA